MRLTIAYSKIKKQNLVLINNATYKRETLSERPIRQPLNYFLPHFSPPELYDTKHLRGPVDMTRNITLGAMAMGTTLHLIPKIM